jgi:hypothetical protein
MGLDQYAWIKKAEAARDEHEFVLLWLTSLSCESTSLEA